MPRWNGGVIGAANNPTLSSAKGIWSLSEATKAVRAGLWPVSNAGADPYFENVTLLLPGDGTNGAQNNTFLDSSTNAFTITRNGNTTQGTFTPFSKPDGRWSNYFDGNGDYLGIGSNAVLSPGTGDFTIEGWVNFSALPSSSSTSAICQNDGIGTSSNDKFWFGLYNSSGTYQLSLGRHSASNRAYAVWTPTLGQWYHLAVSRSSGTVYLFVNGVSQSVTDSTTFSGISLGQNGFSIGAASTPWYLNGYISNFRYTVGAALYTATFTAITSPLTTTSQSASASQVEILTCQSNRFVDNSTNAFAITRNGDVSVQTFSPFPALTAYASGTNGGSGYFDGSGDYLSTGTNSAFAFGTGDFTLECWVYATSTPSDVGIYEGRSNGSTTDGFTLTAFSGSVIRIFAGSALVSSSGTSYVNTWAHVAVVRQSGTTTLYINGVSQGTSTTSYNCTNTDAIIGGGRYGGTSAVTTNFPGYISNFRMVKGTAVYTAAFTPPTAPLTNITNTSLLLSGTNGGIIDNAMSNDLETVGNAQISTTQSKFGGASIYIPTPIGPQVLTPAAQNVVLGAVDFTIECWYYPVSKPDVAPCIIGNDTTGSFPTNYWALHDRHSGVSSTAFSFYCGNANGSTGFLVGTSTVSNNAWYHVAVTRSGNTWRLFVNGTVEATATSSASIDGGVAKRLSIGRSGYGDSGLNAYIDDLRITKGYARYTSNFTAPTAPFVGFGD